MNNKKYKLNNPKDVQELIDMVENGDLSDLETCNFDSDENDDDDDDDILDRVETIKPFRPGANEINRREAEELKNNDDDAEEEDVLEELEVNEESCSEEELSHDEEETCYKGSRNKNSNNKCQRRQKTQKKQKDDVKWERCDFQTQIIHWESPSRNNSLTQPLTPLEYFSSYLSDKDFENMAKYTNMYAMQQGLNFRLTCTSEIQTLFSLHIIIGCLNKFPRVRMYWESVLGMEAFLENMTRDRFFQLRSCLHLVNNLEKPNDCKDRFFKVRPIMEAIRKRCNELELEENLSIDEQIIPFRGTLNIKQYIKGKPCPWGIKVFVICGESGKAYDFLPYQGKSTELEQEMLKKYGLGASVVLHLSQIITKVGHKLYYDNYFSSYALLLNLKERKICAAGTIRVNRFFAPPLLSDKEAKKFGRGWVDEVVSKDGIVAIKWIDNKSVCLASNFIGKGEVDKVKRWDKQSTTHIEVQRPEVIKLYNQSMGGVDILDQLISYYRIFIRSKKWTLRVIMHFVDFALANSWLEYKQDCHNCNVPKKDIMDLLSFRMRVAETLMLMGKVVPKNKRGRPSSSSPIPSIVVHRRGEKRPLTEIQTDKIDHMPQVDQNKEATRCKLLGCKGRTHIYCDKCKIHLCLLRDRNCFTQFHRNNN